MDSEKVESVYESLKGLHKQVDSIGASQRRDEILRQLSDHISAIESSRSGSALTRSTTFADLARRNPDEHRYYLGIVGKIRAFLEKGK